MFGAADHQIDIDDLGIVPRLLANKVVEKTYKEVVVERSLWYIDGDGALGLEICQSNQKLQ
jgi:hypothetical protein